MKLLAALASTTALVLAAPAAATGARDSATFTGTCELSGVVLFHPALTNNPAPVRQFARATGACSGTLVDDDGDVRVLTADRATYRARARGVGSCGAGSTQGEGVLRVGGEKIHFRFFEGRATAVAAIRLEGRDGGSATGEAHASEEEDPVEIAERCAGKGVHRAHADISLATTPAISG